MKPITEEDLIAYQLGELPWWRRLQVRRALDHDAALAADCEAIAATLRTFRCDAPVPSDAALDRSWTRLRSSIGVHEAPSRRPAMVWALPAGSVAATLLLASAWVLHRPGGSASSSNPAVHTAAAVRTWSSNVLGELHTRKTHPALVNDRPGPLTTAPVDAVAEDPALAAHLDTAERVLTEVSHSDGPLPQETRDQVHRLMLSNALYHNSAEAHGDHATAAVIDDLGRVLISLDAEPPRTSGSADAFRLQMNLGGVLLDLRILHHNASSTLSQ